MRVMEGVIIPCFVGSDQVMVWLGSRQGMRASDSEEPSFLATRHILKRSSTCSQIHLVTEYR